MGRPGVRLLILQQHGKGHQGKSIKVWDGQLNSQYCNTLHREIICGYLEPRSFHMQNYTLSTSSVQQTNLGQLSESAIAGIAQFTVLTFCRTSLTMETVLRIRTGQGEINKRLHSIL